MLGRIQAAEKGGSAGTAVRCRTVGVCKGNGLTAESVYVGRDDLAVVQDRIPPLMVGHKDNNIWLLHKFPPSR